MWRWWRPESAVSTPFRSASPEMWRAEDYAVQYPLWSTQSIVEDVDGMLLGCYYERLQKAIASSI
jgi:hypothetical protein